MRFLLALLLLLPVVAQAAPTVRSQVSYSTGSVATSHNVTMPGTIEAGDYLYVACVADEVATFTWPGSWVEMHDDDVSAISASAAYLVAVGNEDSTTISVGLSSSQTLACHTWAVQDASDPPEMATPSTGFDAAPNPPTVTPSEGTADYLILALSLSDDSWVNVTGFPSTYTGTGYRESEDSADDTDSASGGGNVVIAWGQKSVTSVASENPGTFALAGSESWFGYTVAFFDSGGTPTPPSGLAVRSANTYTGDAVAGVHTAVNLPADIEPDDWILVMCTSDSFGASVEFGWPGGWTELTDENHGAISGAAAYKLAVGTEDSMGLTVTTSGTYAMACRNLAIQGGNTSAPPEVSIQTSSASTSPNPPTLSPSDLLQEYLWIVFAGVDQNWPPTGFPTNYSNSGSASSGSDSWDVAIGWAERLYEAETEDPDVFTIGSLRTWLSFTIAVVPDTIEPPPTPACDVDFCGTFTCNAEDCPGDSIARLFFPDADTNDTYECDFITGAGICNTTSMVCQTGGTEAVVRCTVEDLSVPTTLGPFDWYGALPSGPATEEENTATELFECSPGVFAETCE